MNYIPLLQSWTACWRTGYYRSRLCPQPLPPVKSRQQTGKRKQLCLVGNKNTENPSKDDRERVYIYPWSGCMLIRYITFVINWLFYRNPLLRYECLSHRDLKLSTDFELTTKGWSLFQCLTTLTVKYDFCPFNFVPSPLVPIAQFISCFFLIDFVTLVQNLRISNTYPRFFACGERTGFNRSSCYKLLNAGVCLILFPMSFGR